MADETPAFRLTPKQFEDLARFIDTAVAKAFISAQALVSGSDTDALEKGVEAVEQMDSVYQTNKEAARKSLVGDT